MQRSTEGSLPLKDIQGGRTHNVTQRTDTHKGACTHSVTKRMDTQGGMHTHSVTQQTIDLCLCYIGIVSHVALPNSTSNSSSLKLLLR